MPTKARWSLLSKVLTLIPARSSHCLSITPSAHLLTYGGELKPREPVDPNEGPLKGSLHLFDLKSHIGAKSIGWQTISPNVSPAIASRIVPDARVGATTVYEGGHLYLWGGRGGIEMAPLEGTQTGLWRAELHVEGHASSPPSLQWDYVDPRNPDDAPVPRSYHCAVSHKGKIYIHAGCPSSGRLSSLHSFDIASRTWTQLAQAPDPPRGGTALVVSTIIPDNPLLVRYGGFSGYELPNTEGEIDIYSITTNDWKTILPSPDPTHGYPGARSVHGFAAFPSPANTSSEQRSVAILYHGERDASSLGHAGAGSFWDDVWLLKCRADDVAVGMRDWQWEKVQVESDENPEGRGWFPSAVWFDGDEGKPKVVLYGGLLSSNERSGELWVLDVDP